jgi:hypothetical protein
MKLIGQYWMNYIRDDIKAFFLYAKKETYKKSCVPIVVYLYMLYDTTG